MFVRVNREAIGPTGQHTKTKLPSGMRDAPTSGRQVREICRCCHSLPASVYIKTYAILEMVETIEICLTIGDDDDGKCTDCYHSITFVVVDMDNTVTWAVIGPSVYVCEQRTHMFSKLITCFCSNGVQQIHVSS